MLELKVSINWEAFRSDVTRAHEKESIRYNMGEAFLLFHL